MLISEQTGYVSANKSNSRNLCAKTQKIKIFPRGNDNICKKNRTFVVIEYISYNRREVRTNRDTKPLSSKNVRQLRQLMY